MTQVFIFGASIVHGVGAEESGWADLIKKKLHQKIYSEHGVDEKYEVYNFGKSGATIEFVQNEFDQQITYYKKNAKTIAILSVGMNNSKAEGTSENYVSTVIEYKDNMEELLQKMKSQVDHILCVSFTPVDEAKTTPMKKGGSYYWNKRIQEFNKAFNEVCDKESIQFVSITVDQEEWKKNYLYKDGLHPNQKGHQLIFENVYPHLEKLL